VLEAQNGANCKSVAFCGTRGLPAYFGRFQAAVHEISKRFVESGYDCVVLCRKPSGGPPLNYHKGRRLAHVYDSSCRWLDTDFYAFHTDRQLVRGRTAYEQVYSFNNDNFPEILLTLLACTPISVNNDGMEWCRAK
jgi:hypothetical protein